MSSLNIYKDENCKKTKDCDLYFDKDSYIVAIESNILGFFSLTEYNKKTVLVNYELLKKYRNMGIGNDFYKIIEKYIIDNYDYERIVLVISYDNCKSINIAISHNYTLDNEFDELNEVRNHKVYAKSIERKQQ